ncbi:MAG: ABC transporter ATP-binding protein [Anaerolineae bacterium]|nr:ABC transporter ATP-binding protein [Anaerolineae bacterium]
MASVTYEHVTKRFGDVAAVVDLDIHIKDREFLVFVGPSGCGKSTSLRMLAGLEEITEGTIKIGDRIVNNVPPKDRDIAMVFQSYALYPHMTVFDNMAFGLKLRKTPKDEIRKRVQEAARSLGIEDLLDRRPRQLSGGQRQRVAVGRAIVREPAVFLMDEPLSNLDAKLRVEARAEISRLHHRLGTTFIYVTHDQTEAMTMGSRICVLSAGVLQQLDSPQNLYDFPDNVFVAGFIGSPAMNFRRATVKQENGTLVVDTGDFSVVVPPERARQFPDAAGKEVIFGIRPEDIHDPQYVPSGVHTANIPVDVDVVEEMGNEKIVYVRDSEKRDLTPLVARIDPRSRPVIGEKVEVALNMDNVNMFDAATEKTLWVGEKHPTDW